MDLLEGLQASKMSFSSHSGSDSPVHSQLRDGSPYAPGGAEEGGLPAHTAWRLLLDSRLPFLSAELQAAADVLLLYITPASADETHSFTMKGVML